MDESERDILINDLIIKGKRFINNAILLSFAFLTFLILLIDRVIIDTLNDPISDLVVPVFTMISMLVSAFIVRYSRKYYIIIWGKRLKKRINDLDIIRDVENRAREMGILSGKERII